MTTTVTVSAHAGWAVQVTAVCPRTGHPEPPQTVAAGEEGTFYVHSGQDLRIHEVQPEPGAAEPRTFAALPVAGYSAQDEDKVALVNANKFTEEGILRVLDEMKGDPQFDQRWLAVARTGIEQGFMALNRAIFQPGRVALPQDRV
ncbi:hypothetical protein RGUI_2767 [Rhodovulum sp. P5]|uniref:Acb2/Tad1 domain-containing protein n=1 Tax=Rhodovulum sp. P5 TaxID=1564506 RepID=UPI0009C3228C|nr:hypothetical protein [Rhodovulum sp. P5]ARE40908.1 hypothetical protein RGUI_2767 [Rhodovulum sp. P5]